MAELKVGTSGWSYKEWEGVFYPAGEKKKLSFYARYFTTAEIDSSFYAYPGKNTVTSWLNNSPPGFVFSIKLPKLITHDKALDISKGTKADFSRFLYLTAPMLRAGKLGPVLIQLPPSFTFDRRDRLDAFLGTLPREMQFAVEFRHRSWLREETWDLLGRHNVANTVVDEPLLPPDTVVTADFSFIRWHGHGSRPWYNYRYDKKEELEPWKRRLEDIKDKTRKTSYGYFNNHYGGRAVENALQMMEIMNLASPEQREVARLITERLDGKLPPVGTDAEQQNLELFGS